jgi:ATP-binding cassette, subfamily B, bacterial
MKSSAPQGRDPQEAHARSSRRRYTAFVHDYKGGRLDDDDNSPGKPAQNDSEKKDGAGDKKARRRKYIREYGHWLWPHRYEVGALFALALVVAGLELIEPLFLRYIVDHILLKTDMAAAVRLHHLNFAGGLFVGVVVLSRLIGAVKDYRQRRVNVNVMLSLRRSLFDRLLHLPLPKLWDMKTGGILSRLTGDVETTTGLLQLAFMSPATSAIRLLVAIGLLLALNWRLALMALAIVPGITLMSFAFSKRIRPIYRSVRKDVEHIDGRVGETISGIRVVRAFGREVRELLGYLVGRHTVLRKEMFAQRRETILWTSWGLLLGAVNVVIVWYGGYLNLAGGASIGDIMAFQWYTFLLLSPSGTS